MRISNVPKILIAALLAMCLPLAASAQTYNAAGSANVGIKKTNGILTTTALTASSAFTSSWQDSTSDNTSLVNLETYSAVGGGTLVVQESNDTSGTLSSFPVQVLSAPIGAATTTRTETYITARYWRVIYTNGTTAQTTFEIAYTSAGIPYANSGLSGTCSLAALNAACTIPMSGLGGIAMSMSGSWSGTAALKGDAGLGTFPFTVQGITTSGTAANTFTSAQNINIGALSYVSVEVVMTAYTSGSVTINWHTGASAPVLLNNGVNFQALGAPGDNTSNSITGPLTPTYNLYYNPTTASWDRARKDGYPSGPEWTTSGGSTTLATAVGTAGPTVIKNSAGRLVDVLITAAGTTSETYYDNASACSGTIIGVTPASTSVGQPYVFNHAAVNGITACGAASTSPGFTTSYF